MTDYQAMYLLLFNTVTDALRCLENGETAKAGELLVLGQQACETIYMESSE